VKTYAFIPARGGSTGVIRKNIRKLGGRPLIFHTINFAKSIDFFEQIIISTDDSEIAEISTNGKITAKIFKSLTEDQVIEISKNFMLHRRKNIQANTLSPIRDTLFDIAKDEHPLSNFDYVCMLQPTSPFRHKNDIEGIQTLIESANVWTSIASVTEVGGMHPDRMYRVLTDKYLQAFQSQATGDNKPRQLLEKLFIKDGAYYMLKKTTLKTHEMLGDKMLPLFRNGFHTINIDTELDFKIAELVVDNFVN
jgi:CMP-N-acetylneuraminic acid synthetase